MLSRGAFVGAAFAFAAATAPLRAAALETTSPGQVSPTGDGRTTLEIVSVIVATQAVVRTAWRPPALFPATAPVAYYVGRNDRTYPGDPVIWLNPDHPELVSPRRSVLTDEIPLFTEILLASADLRISGMPSLGLERLDAEHRRLSAASMAGRAAVVAKFSSFEQVDDAEFARRAFAFAVLRQMTPDIGGVAPFSAPEKLPPGEAAAVYAGVGADARAPHGWGVIYADFDKMRRDAAGYDSWVRAFVL
ncbi:MAG: hypothetical protein QOJ39_104, partial [Candidatus Eremiobacteraeota bacterium]|nr:hypothetical protein [Candidatus Eremiobacteraeota bacterium]